MKSQAPYVKKSIREMESFQIPEDVISEILDSPKLEKARSALILRRQGLTLREIGERNGYSTPRARQLVDRAERFLRFARTHGGKKPLPLRAYHVLTAEGFDTREDILKGVLDGRVAQGKLINYGPKTHKIVCHWLGITHPEAITENPDTVKRYTKHLEKRGYKVVAEGEK